MIIRGFPESYWGMSQKYFEQKVFDTSKLRGTNGTNLTGASLLRTFPYNSYQKSRQKSSGLTGNSHTFSYVLVLITRLPHLYVQSYTRFGTVYSISVGPLFLIFVDQEAKAHCSAPIPSRFPR